MISGAESIAAALSMLHDGDIECVRINNGNIDFNVAISYLAQRITSTDRCFKISLIRPGQMTFSTWENDPPGASTSLPGLEVLLTHRLEILDASAEGEMVKLVCNARGANASFCGGELYFAAAAIDIRDESGNAWTVEELARLAQSYWDAFGRGGPYAG